MSGQQPNAVRAREEGASESTNWKPPEKQIALVVLGMHRSGTSAFTRVFSIAGATLPTNINAADVGNETGYWEPDALIQYDDRLLAEFGSAWRDWRPLDLAKVSIRRRAEIQQEIAEIIAAEYHDAPLIVVKEPRVCRFAMLFLDALESADIECRCVLPVRSPLEVVQSLAQRDGLSRSEVALLWLRHMLDAEWATRDRKRAITTFDDLLADWKSTFDRVTEQLQVPWKYTADEIASQVEAFVSPAQRHHKCRIEDVLLDPVLRNWMGEAYSALLVLGRNPSSSAALRALDRIRFEFNGASPIMAELLLEERAARTAHVQKLDGALGQAQARTVSLQSESEQLRGRVLSLEAALSEALGKVADLGAELSARTADRERVAARLAEAEHSFAMQLEELHVAALAARLGAEERERALERQRAVAREDKAVAKQAISELAEKLAHAQERQAIAERREAEARLGAEAAQAETERLRLAVAEREAHLHSMGTSTSWRLTRPLRGLKKAFIDTEFRRRLAGAVARRLGWASMRRQGPLQRWSLPWAAHVTRGLLSDAAYRGRAFRRMARLAVGGRWSEHSFAPAPSALFSPGLEGRAPTQAPDQYQVWLEVNALTDSDRRELRAALALRQGRTPRISVITPAYNSDPRLLKEAVESVRAQIYDNWELCIVDDASPAAHARPLLASLAAMDGRIKIGRRDVNGGIAEATNAAVAMAAGDVVAFLDHDDVLTPDCLAELALYYADHPDADVVYSDDDKIDLDGRRFAPQFKPDCAPTLLMSYMYMGHVFSTRRALFEELGGFRKAFDGSQDYDFALRAIERARHVGHVPKVLYSWRVAPGSTAASGDAKPESFEAGRRAVEEALQRRDVNGRAHYPAWARGARCGIFSVEFPDDGPRVTLIIPTKDKLEFLRPCVESLARTSYRNFDVMIVDNDSMEPATQAYLAQLSAACAGRVERISNHGGPFSFARINNEAVRRADAEFVLLLNNDTIVREPRWLSQMMGYAQLQGVGAVGAKLLFGDGAIQHAGIVHGLYDGLAGPAFRNRDGDDWGYLNYLKVAREYAAVTAACMLVRRSLYLDLGGLDETRFNVAYNDVDFCYRLADAGYRCVFCPDAELFHFEGKSRGAQDNPREIAAFRAKYRGRRDPWYNPNLSIEDEQFRIRAARPPRRSARAVRAIMVSHNLEHEGAPNSMLELVVGLHRRGLAEPVVLSPADGPLRAHYEAAGVEVRIIPNPIADVHTDADFRAAMAQFAKLLRSLNGEAVYANTLQTFWAIAGAHAAALPAVWNPRESEPWDRYFDYLPPALRSCAYACFDQAYAVVFVAHATRANWAPATARRNVRVIHNGINADRLAARVGAWTREKARARLAVGAGEIVVTLVGTVCDRKGQLDLVDALPHLSAASRRKFRAFVVGDRAGPYSERLHAAAAALPPSLRERLAIVAETDDPYLYFRAADVALCTSRVESYPRILLEAMACGLPIITTPAFGIAEQVREEVNALLYAPGQPAELAAALDRIIADDGLRARMGADSGAVLESLTRYDDMLNEYARVLREAAGRRG